MSTSTTAYSSLWKKGSMTKAQHSEYIIHYKESLEVLPDFIPPEIISLKTGVRYTDKQFSDFHAHLPSLELLASLRNDNWVVVAGPPKQYCLWEILRSEESSVRVDGQVFPLGSPIDLRGMNILNMDKERLLMPQWMAFKRNPIVKKLSEDWHVGSWEMNWERQQTLLSENELAPTALEVAWVLKMLLLFYVKHPCFSTMLPLAESKRFHSSYTLTSTLIEGDQRLMIGACSQSHDDTFRFTVKAVDADFNAKKAGLDTAHRVGLCPIRLF